MAFKPSKGIMGAGQQGGDEHAKVTQADVLGA